MTIIQEILHAWAKESKLGRSGYYIPLKNFKYVEEDIKTLLPKEMLTFFSEDRPEKSRLKLINERIYRHINKI